MTLLVASIPVSTMNDVTTLSAVAFAGGADAVELRIDSYQEDWNALADYLRRNPTRQWIITTRSPADLPNAAREHHARYCRLAETTATWVDFDLTDWDSLPAADRLVWESRPPGSLILSRHDFHGRPEDVASTVNRVRSLPFSPIAKVAYRPADITETFDALDLLRQQASRTIAVAMEEEGLWTRVLAKKLGAAASYCSIAGAGGTAPGQLTLEEMRGLFRWQRISATTRVFGVLGDPVAHSLSPGLFNSWFDEMGVDAVYLPLRVRGDARLGRFLEQCLARPWLDVGGFSITLPHKVTALQWLGSRADRTANGVGAVNTLVLRDQQITGFNTDCYAALASLSEALGCSTQNLHNRTVDILGAGGAARAVASGLAEVGARVTIFARSPNRAKWASQTGCQTAAWDERVRRRGEIVVNTTPIGMWPEVEASPMPPASLQGCELVFDLIYNPMTTRLLRDAVAAGARPLNGLDMFIRQAAMQFELWTGRAPSRSSGLARAQTLLAQRALE